MTLQESHIKKSEVKYLINKRLGKEFFSLIVKKKRGMVLYVKKELRPKKVFEDKQGRLVAV